MWISKTPAIRCFFQNKQHVEIFYGLISLDRNGVTLYCRTVKSERISNDKKKGQNNRKNGNPYLAWAFSEAATYAIRYDRPIKQWYERKKRRSNAPKALNALACKLAKAVWHVMQGKDFDMEMLFG